ncbi:MAG TPA: MFS transporter [Bryobacteraceae bacterium]|nr:MFS transporter [Bryobacteraceae bacterium]
MEAPQHNPPWLFAILSLPYGLGNAIITILIPYLLRKQGVPVDRIAAVVAIATAPTIWSFVYSPVVDMGLRRRTWLWLAAFSAALFSAFGVLISARSLSALTVLLFLATAVSGLISSANGALLTALPATIHGRAAGWYNAGNIGGGALGGGLAIWLAGAVRVPELAVCVGLLLSLPMLAAFRVIETPLARTPAWLRIVSLARDLRSLVASRRTLAGLVFFLSPAGSAAIANLISGVGPDYRASAREVLLISGVAGGLLNTFGSLGGGFFCERVDTRKAYAFAGLLSAVFAGILALAPHNPFTYAAGYSGYAIAGGFAYAVFTALVLDVLGPRRHAAATSYSLLAASGNVPIVYMTWLDGLGYKAWGARGLMGFDALANGAAGLGLLVFAAFTHRFWSRERSGVDAS